MKYKMAMLGTGILLLFTLTVVVSGERVVSSSKTPAEVEQKEPVGQAPRAPDNVVKPTPRNDVRGREVSTYESQEAATAIEPLSMESAADAADYDIPWQSINAGGGDLQSASYQVSSSVGQSVIGYATSDNYQAGIGYWYGTAAPSGCDCGAWGDVNNDGQINPQDVTFMVQFVYFQNDIRIQPPNCPLEAGDVAGCDGQVNPQDVTFYVQYVYFQNDMFCPVPCGP